MNEESILNVHEKEYKELIAKLKRSTIPDHTEALVRLIEILKDEIEYLDVAKMNRMARPKT